MEPSAHSSCQAPASAQLAPLRLTPGCASGRQALVCSSWAGRAARPPRPLQGRETGPCDRGGSGAAGYNPQAAGLAPRPLLLALPNVAAAAAGAEAAAE